MGKFNKKRAGGLAFWLVLWEVLSQVKNLGFLFPGPLQVFKRLIADLVKGVSLFPLLRTLGLAGLGIVSGLGLALFFLYLSLKLKGLSGIIESFIQALKTIPMASMILILLLFFQSSYLSFLLCFIVVLPIYYYNFLEGYKNRDPKLLEMAQVFQMSGKNRLKYIDFPSLFPYFLAASRLALGMGFKASIMGEVLGMVPSSLGGLIYESKVYLDIEGLFSQTILAVLVLTALERGIIIWMEKYGFKGQKSPMPPR